MKSLQVWRAMALFFATATLSACAWSQPPRSSDAIAPPFVVEDPLFSRSTGKIFLLPEGLWAYVTEGEEHSAGVGLGEIVVYTTAGNEALEHVFAVVLERPWGVMLQRIDANPLRIQGRGHLAPLTDFGAPRGETKRTPAACKGSGDTVQDNACLNSLPVGTRWSVYALESEERVRLRVAAEIDKPSATMPIRRIAHLYTRGGGENRHTVFTGNQQPLSGAWVAVPATPAGVQPLVPPARASVALHTGCQPPASALTPTYLSWVSMSDAPRAHPMQVEALAYEHGVDALAWCDDKQVTLATAAMFRPLLVALDGSFLGAPLLGQKPIRLEGFAQETRALVLALGGAVSAATAAGDFTTADFWLESLLTALPENKSVHDMGLSAMQVTALSGRPEAAVRTGWFATRSAWNRETNPAFSIGLIAAYAQMGMPGAVTERVGNLPKVVSGAKDDELGTWLMWNHFRNRIAQGKQIHLMEFDKAVATLQDESPKKPIWALTLRGVALTHTAKTTPHAQAAWTSADTAFAREDMAALWQGMRDLDTSLACEGPCPVDSYGRRLSVRLSRVDQVAALDAIVTDLRLVGVIPLRPGFNWDELLGASTSLGPLARANMVLGAFPLLQSGDKERAVSSLSEALQHALAEQSGGQSAVCERASEVADFGRETVLRSSGLESSSADRELAQVLGWLTGKGLQAACKGPVELIAAARDWLGRRSANVAYTLPLFEGVIVGASSGEQRLHTLKLAASFAQEQSDAQHCRRWTLALAAAMAHAGQVEAASEHIIQSVNCGGSSSSASDYARSRALISSYIRYQRTGSLDPGAKAEVRELLAQATLQDIAASDEPICVGLQPLEYDFFSYLEPELQVLALSVAVPPAPANTLTLRTSTSVVEMANAALRVARRALAQGRLQVAVNSLLEARELYASVNHLPGQARINFIEETLFDGDIASFLDQTQPIARALSPQWVQKSRLQDLPARLRGGHARSFLEDLKEYGPQASADLQALVMAASLIVEDDRLTLERWRSLGGGDESIGTLCAPPDPGVRLIL